MPPSRNPDRGGSRPRGEQPGIHRYRRQVHGASGACNRSHRIGQRAAGIANAHAEPAGNSVPFGPSFADHRNDAARKCRNQAVCGGGTGRIECRTEAAKSDTVEPAAPLAATAEGTAPATAWTDACDGATGPDEYACHRGIAEIAGCRSTVCRHAKGFGKHCVAARRHRPRFDRASACIRLRHCACRRCCLVGWCDRHGIRFAGSTGCVDCCSRSVGICDRRNRHCVDLAFAARRFDIEHLIRHAGIPDRRDRRYSASLSQPAASAANTAPVASASPIDVTGTASTSLSQPATPASTVADTTYGSFPAHQHPRRPHRPLRPPCRRRRPARRPRHPVPARRRSLPRRP